MRHCARGWTGGGETVRETETTAALPAAASAAAGTATRIEDASRVVDAGSLADDWGVQIIGINRTAGGYMLDFRFRVLDALKAAPLFDRKTRPYLVDEATGARFMVPSPPKTGPLRSSTPPTDGIVYWMFFANPGQALPVGTRVTVVIGDFQARDLSVQ